MEILLIITVAISIIIFINNKKREKNLNSQLNEKVIIIDKQNQTLKLNEGKLEESDTRIKDLSSSLELSQKKATGLELLIKKYEPIIDIDSEVEKLKKDKLILEESLRKIQEYYSDYELRTDLEEMSFYQPKYNFENYLEFADALEIIREAQKELIRQKEIFTTIPASQNREIGNLAVNAFNGDATTIIDSITYNNFEKSKEKLTVTFNKINNLLQPYNLQISEQYLSLKIKEMALVYDLKEQERRIKEEQIELKEQMKEEEKARVEAEKAREKAIQEQDRYEKALQEARIEVESKSGAEKEKYEKQIQQLEEKLKEALAEKERATAMAQITKKGHVYIISNIGSFGENVYKIGMTRRKDPIDRVNELGDASVPFGFDVHAMVYTDDAPAFENALHKEFEQQRMNKINLRKEFFKVGIDDIEGACKKLGYKIQLTKLAEAREYRQTLDVEKVRN